MTEFIPLAEIALGCLPKLLGWFRSWLGKGDDTPSPTRNGSPESRVWLAEDGMTRVFGFRRLWSRIDISGCQPWQQLA